MVGGESLQMTLTAGIIDHVSQIKTQEISIYIYTSHNNENGPTGGL